MIALEIDDLVHANAPLSPGIVWAPEKFRQACRSAGVRLIAPQLHCDVRGAVDDVTSGGASFVTVMQAADFPKCDYITLGDALHASGHWRVFRQREFRARSVIVRKVAGQDSAQMRLAEYHHVFQAVAQDVR